MLASSIILFTLAATGLAEVPLGYRHVYITSNVDKTFVVVPTSPKNGSTTVVFVVLKYCFIEHTNVGFDHF